MNILEFRDAFKNYPLISKREIEKHFPGYTADALTRWQKKGYVIKIRNGFYRLSDNKFDRESVLYWVANRLYNPSYVSLQSAFSYYNFIPEGVFQVTSVSAKANRKFSTPEGRFVYKNLKPELIFGYNLVRTEDLVYKLATPEKAVLDFLHLYPQYKTESDMAGLRWNVLETEEKFNYSRAEKYLKVFNSKALSRRYRIFKNYTKNYAII